MKRLLLMMAAVASVTAATPLAAPAFARDGEQRGRAERQERGPRAEPRRGPERGERRGGEERSRPRYDGDDRRGRAPVLGYGDNGRRNDGRRDNAGRDDDDRGRYAPRPVYEPRQREEDRPRYGGAPRPQGFSGPPSAARRGGYLPRNFSGEIVDDFRRYRLRTPPAGFAWVRMGNGFALVSMRDGQIFDMVQ